MELIKQIDTVKEFIDKLVSKLPLSVAIAFKAGLKILFVSGKANINIIITPIQPIIIKISKLLEKVDLDKLTK